MVSFEERNLKDSNFWEPRAFEVIFCRNVLMYLSPATTMQVIERFARSLTRDGYLFLGHAESLNGISRDFVLEHSDGAFYYRPRIEIATTAVRTNPGNSTVAKVIRPPAVPKKPALADPRASRTCVDGIPDPSPSQSMVEALAIIDRLPPSRRDDPDVVLLTAALLCEKGKLDQAEELCASLLAADNLNPSAHYLRALCREHWKDIAQAREGYGTAIYLDPNFAMPHLRLALLLKHDGDREHARHPPRSSWSPLPPIAATCSRPSTRSRRARSRCSTNQPAGSRRENGNGASAALSRRCRGLSR